METRTVTQTKVFMLIMNPMTGRAEGRSLAALSFDRQKLVDFHESEKAEEAWSDGGYHKTFKNNSPLEWFNPVHDFENGGLFGHGIFEEWVNDLSKLRGDIPLIE